MALNASMNWWVRAGGSASNGGGFDAAVAGAGTNYADQDAAQVVFSAGNANRLSTSGAGATTVTSAGTPFTSAMVGNVIRISGGTNFQTGYYTVVTYTDASNVVLDRTPTSGGAGSDGVGSLGGAFATIPGSLSTGGTVTAPTITSPLAAGHKINLCGGGTDNPASADYTQTGYATYPAGTLASGRIRVVGYNGRPRIDCNDMTFYQPSYWAIDNLMLTSTGAVNPTLGRIGATTATIVSNVRIDQAGYDVAGIVGHVITGCHLINSGSTSAGTQPAIVISSSGGSAVGNLIDGWRGYGIAALSNTLAIIRKNIVTNCKATGSPGIRVIGTSAIYRTVVESNSVYGGASDGIYLEDDDSIAESFIANNILYNNGGYGINASVGSVALNDRLRSIIDYNAFGSNTSGALNNLSAGDNDITLSADPFTNAAGGDYSLNSTAGGGADLKGVAFPTSIP